MSKYQEIAPVNDADILTAKAYLADPSSFVTTYSVTVNGKKRSIVTYQSNESGVALRRLHHHIDENLRKTYRGSKASFAYKQNLSIMDCLKRHMRSSAFLKSDIHHYFDTITLERTTEKFRANNKAVKLLGNNFDLVFSSCFYDGKLPIGFITSPVISDYYLLETDQYFAQQTNIIYTRYADDFIISAKRDVPVDVLESALAELRQRLNDDGLSVNEKKTYIRELKIPGDAIHLLGLNIVKTKTVRNRITVSNSYIRETCMDLCDAIRQKDTPGFNEVLTASRLSGKIAFIRSSSEGSMKKLERMFEVKYGEWSDLSEQAVHYLLGTGRLQVLTYNDKTIRYYGDGFLTVEEKHVHRHCFDYSYLCLTIRTNEQDQDCQRIILPDQIPWQTCTVLNHRSFLVD